jgi:hypothetical protein
MEPENPDQNKEVIKNSQMNSLNKGQIIEPEQNNNLMQSESQNPNINIQNKEIENNENPNINDNNSDFVSKNNYNEEMEAAGEGEENNENIEQNLENENYEENINNRMMMNNNDLNFNMYNQNNNDMNGNENMELNNENENYQNDQQLFNDENIDESVKNYIFELQNKLNQVMNENDKLRMINQKLLAGLNDLKNRNIALNQKLNKAQIQNQRMNQEFAKLKQVKSNNMEILNLRNQIQDYEKMIYKLNNDKIILESKIGNMQIPPTNQIQNINLLNYKNNQLINSPKNKMPLNPKNNISNEDNQIFKNKIMILEKNNKKLSQSNSELENQNKYLQKENQKMFVDLKNKDNYIINLNDKISEFNNEYNRQINTFHKDKNQTQSLLNQLFFERDRLVKENTDLKNAISQLNYKVKEISMIIQYKNSQNNDKMKIMYEDKLKEYKNKIVILKNRINELLGVETHGNYLLSRGNSARNDPKNTNTNALRKNKSFKYNKNLNILTDFNLYRGPNKTVKEFGKNYSNFNFGTK